MRKRNWTNLRENPPMMIFETIVTTASPAGAVHIAPMGVRYDGECVILMPFKPSTTLENILASRCAVLNLTTDTRVFAGCVTGRRDWPVVPAETIPCVRLATSLNHAELHLAEVRDDPTRPVLLMTRGFAAHHAEFAGFNRAQAAIIEGAVLISRLHMLPAAKIDSELAYLQIAIDKTAGPAELEAWQWLHEAVEKFRATQRPGTAA
jgi:hypothetical protein